MHINSIFSLHFIFPHPPPALIIINFRFLSAIGEWSPIGPGPDPDPNPDPHSSFYSYSFSRRSVASLSGGWIQWNSLGPPALSPFPRPTNLECNNMAIVVYCYENLLIVSRSSGQELWMGCGSLHSAVLLGAPWVFFFRKTLSRRPIVANSIHSWSATRAGSWPDCRGAILQLLLCRLPPQIRCSITLRKFLGNSWTIPRASIELH